MDGNNTHLDFDAAMKQRFGGKVYRLSLSSGCSCPNRDGKVSFGGCIFCSEGGSGDFASDKDISITEQIAAAKEKVAAKLSQSFKGYIAYFQSFTNTYVKNDEELKALKRKFTEAITNPEVLALSVATRPDCLGPEIITMLSELNSIKPVWVELGLQTVHDKTAELINRGYELSVYDRAVDTLKAAGIEVIVHVIIGLPGETDDMIKETVRHIAKQNVDGIKLQLLHVLKNTKLAEMIENGSMSIHEYTLSEYTKLLCELIELLPEKTVIHRFTGDAPKKLLISPLWTADKKKVHNTIKAALHRQ